MKDAKDDFDTIMQLSQGARTELQWWVSNAENSFSKLSREKPQYTITTDASLAGWGAEYKGTSTGGA